MSNIELLTLTSSPLSQLRKKYKNSNISLESPTSSDEISFNIMNFSDCVNIDNNINLCNIFYINKLINKDNTVIINLTSIDNIPNSFFCPFSSSNFELFIKSVKKAMYIINNTDPTYNIYFCCRNTYSRSIVLYIIYRIFKYNESYNESLNYIKNYNLIHNINMNYNNNYIKFIKYLEKIIFIN